MNFHAVLVLEFDITTGALKARGLATLVPLMPLEIAGRSIMAFTDIAIKASTVTVSSLLPGAGLSLDFVGGRRSCGFLSI